ncbi:cell division protein [Ordospora colligata OC4]|uniref:Cell division protein n=1 Tax=Ordospora colligata OC4 TaxID=1354746 RepID=A0A0B2UK26_9MICR|nr:cell division protein [Ordospora colligata OC4]KHN69315.1 cell division protein [Ordospora colligata OC4]
MNNQKENSHARKNLIQNFLKEMNYDTMKCVFNWNHGIEREFKQFCDKEIEFLLNVSEKTFKKYLKEWWDKKLEKTYNEKRGDDGWRKNLYKDTWDKGFSNSWNDIKNRIENYKSSGINIISKEIIIQFLTKMSYDIIEQETQGNPTQQNLEEILKSQGIRTINVVDYSNFNTKNGKVKLNDPQDILYLGGDENEYNQLKKQDQDTRKEYEENCKSRTPSKEEENDFYNTIRTKTIILMGATGSGKSLLINAMANYLLGAEEDGTDRIQILKIDGDGNQSSSQTSKITAYVLFYYDQYNKRKAIQIIDTPGFGDTGGQDRNKQISKQIRDFILKDEMEEIDAVCFVDPNSNVRATPTVKYIANSVLSVFADDVKNNIHLLVTFADSGFPPVVNALKEVPDFPKNRDGKITYYKINNSGLYTNYNDQDKLLSQNFWMMRQETFDNFFSMLAKTNPVSLKKTKENIRIRKNNEEVIESIEEHMNFMLKPYEEAKTEVNKLISNQTKDRIYNNFDDFFEINIIANRGEVNDSTLGNLYPECGILKNLKILRDNVKIIFEKLENVNEEPLNQTHPDSNVFQLLSEVKTKINEKKQTKDLTENLILILDMIQDDSNKNKPSCVPVDSSESSKYPKPSREQKTKPELLMIAVAVILMIIEAVFTGIMIRNVLKNGYGMNDIVMNLAMAIITVMVMLCVIGYVMNRNRPFWHDVAMVGGSAGIAFMRICMLVFLSKYMNIMNIIIMAIGVAMIIASGVAIANKNKIKKNVGGNDKSGNYTNRMTKNVIVTLGLCVMAITVGF